MRIAGALKRICLGVALFGASALAQAQGGVMDGRSAQVAIPSYDVATIRVNTSDVGNMGVSMQKATLVADNANLKMLIGFSYQMRGDLIFSLPPWAEKTHYDIHAKAVDTDAAVLEKLSDAQKRVMVQHLLEDRFHLRCHVETREEPTFELMQVKDGAKLKQSTPEEIKQGTMMTSDTTLEAKGVKLSNLADMLADELGRPVVDKTGLNGEYTIKLHWQREQDAGEQKGSDDRSPALLTALQEQLGLKVQTGRDPIRVLVIDHIEPPTAN